MIKAQKDLDQYCADLTKIISQAMLLKSTTDKIANLETSVRNQELIVPIVGAFSAGKSTLINSILGKSILPVAITPETSLATEMRYSANNYIEAVKEDGSTIRFEVDEFKKVSDNSAQYLYARLYLDNMQLKNIEPLVLVDMPGFDSPLDAHNKAIMAYIGRACHYIVFASVEEGTVSKSLLRHLREIHELGRGFSFFLTKSDLKAQSDIDSLVKLFNDELRDYFDYSGESIPITQTSPDAVLKILTSINVDRVFFDLYKDTVQNLRNDLFDAINIKISAVKKDKNLLSNAVDELENSIGKLQRQTEAAKDDFNRRYAADNISNDVISDLGIALEAELDELLDVARGRNAAAVENCLNEIIRTELNISLSNRLGSVHQEIISNFAASLHSLDKAMRELEIDDEFTQNLSQEIQSELGKLSLLLPIGGPVGLLLKLLLAILPMILSDFFKKLSASRMEEKLRDIFMVKVFPHIKTKFRPELQKIVSDIVHRMIEQTHAQYEERITQKKLELETAIQERDAMLAKNQEVAIQLEEVREAVNSVNHKLLQEYN
ncbi:MAG: dynamin family protein [Deferribacteraceae bacterium]|nr:dynamin family protein [Deferribacteraceae bacterium]